MGSRIIITGTFCSLNKGDAAMRIALADELHRAVPGSHVAITTPFPDVDRGAYNGATVLGCSRRKPRRVLGMLIRASLWRLVYTVFRIDSSGLLDSELTEYRRSDLVVDVSGDGITEEYGLKCLFSHLVPIIFGKLLCRPVFVCAQTIGPFNRAKGFCRWLLNKTEVVTARETLTLDYLRHLGVKPSLLSLTADLAFLMKPAPTERGREILRLENIRQDRPLLGMSVSRLPGHIRGSAGSDEPAPIEVEMAEALDRIVDLGLRPVFISHVTGPGQRRDDRLAAKRIAKLANHSSEIEIIEGDYSPQETKAVIGLTDMFVGVRMHSNIGALSMGVPTISIAYGPKAFGIMGLAGQKQWVLDIRDVTADSLYNLVQKAWLSRTAIEESLEIDMQRVRAMAWRNVEMIESLLGLAVSPQPSIAPEGVLGQN